MPEKKIASKGMIKQIFDDAASEYNRTGPSIFTQFGTRLVEHVSLAPGMRVLDNATGTGAALLPAALCVGSDGRVIGTDLSWPMLREAERAAQAEGLTNVELRAMDAEHLEFSDRTFDAIICAFSIFLFPDMNGALREMHRVLKPGGSIGISVFNSTPPPFSPGWPVLFKQISAYQVGVWMPQQVAYAPEEVKVLLSRCGFRSVETPCETYDIVFASMEEWWAFQLTLGARATILGMDEALRARFKEEYFVKLRPMIQKDGLHFSASVIYAIAQR